MAAIAAGAIAPSTSYRPRQTSIRRAGADLILTYHAKEMAKLLAKGR